MFLILGWVSVVNLWKENKIDDMMDSVRRALILAIFINIVCGKSNGDPHKPIFTIFTICMWYE